MQQRPHEISIRLKDSNRETEKQLEARRLLAELAAHQRAVARHVCNSDAFRVSETNSKPIEKVSLLNCFYHGFE